MGISDYLRVKLAGLPGIDSATSELVGGAQVIRVGDVEAKVGPFASDTEIEHAIRGALKMPESEALIPVPALVETEAAPALPPAPAGKPIPSSGGYTPGSLKTMLQSLRDRQASVMSEVEAKAKRAHQALDRAAKLGSDLDATADSILADIGQYSNHPDDE